MKPRVKSGKPREGKNLNMKGRQTPIGSVSVSIDLIAVRWLGKLAVTPSGPSRG